MAGKVISFVNMKGGVCKTTLTINIGNVLSKKGNKVLIVDMDPQFNATQSLLLYKTRLECNRGVNEDGKQDENFLVEQEINSSERYKKLSENKQTVLQLFESSNIDRPLDNPSLVQEITDKLYLIPGDLTLAKEISGDTANKIGAVLNHFINNNILNEYDYILIDCPPTWSILTHSSLFASDYYVIPSKVDWYSSIGIQLLEDQIKEKIINDMVYKMTARKLKRLGVIFTLVHSRVKAEEQRKARLKQEFPDINFFENDLPYMPSIPTRFIMYEEVENDAKYAELINSIHKITDELINRM